MRAFIPFLARLGSLLVLLVLPLFLFMVLHTGPVWQGREAAQTLAFEFDDVDTPSFHSADGTAADLVAGMKAITAQRKKYQMEWRRPRKEIEVDFPSPLLTWQIEDAWSQGILGQWRRVQLVSVFNPY